MEPAKLTITRNKPNDVKRRQVYVSLDQEKPGFPHYGDSLTREIAPGHHALKVNNTLFWKKVEFDAASSEHVRFAINNYTGRAFYALVLVFGIAPLYLSIERETSLWQSAAAKASRARRFCSSLSEGSLPPFKVTRPVR